MLGIGRVRIPLGRQEVCAPGQILAAENALADLVVAVLIVVRTGRLGGTAALTTTCIDFVDQTVTTVGGGAVLQVSAERPTAVGGTAAVDL